MSVKNWIYTVIALWLHWVFIVWAGLEFAPPIEQAVVAFFVLLFSFIFIIWLRDVALRNVEKHPWVKPIFYPFGLTFLVIDVTFNVNWSWLFLLGDLAGKRGEDLTFTAHCKAIRKYIMEKMAKGKQLTKLEKARMFLIEGLYGKIMNMVDPGHY